MKKKPKTNYSKYNKMNNDLVKSFETGNTNNVQDINNKIRPNLSALDRGEYEGIGVLIFVDNIFEPTLTKSRYFITGEALNYNGDIKIDTESFAIINVSRIRIFTKIDSLSIPDSP